MQNAIVFTLIGALALALLAMAAYTAFSGSFKTDRTLVYRQIDDIKLSISLFEPHENANTPRPAILFFHGGAWTHGSPEQFYPWAKHFAELGWVAGSVEYRLYGIHGTSAFDAVDDSRTAYLYLQERAEELGIDPQRILLAGGSAGGHLAATIAMTPWPARQTVPGPAALVLLNPALNTDYTGDRARPHLFAGKGEQISPAHHVLPGLPPTLIVHGTADSLVPITNSREFCSRMQAANNPCTVIEYEGVDHGFFNWGGDYFERVLADVVNFTQDFQQTNREKTPKGSVPQHDSYL